SALLRYYLGRPREVFCAQQVPYGLFPQTPFKKVFRVTLLLGRYAAPSNLASQATSQETLEQRMKPIFLATAVTGDRNENVTTHQRRQESRAICPFEQRRASIEFDVVQQGYFQQELLNF